MKAMETEVVFIEFQNDFFKEGGKLHPGVKAGMDRLGTVPNAVKLAERARRKGPTAGFLTNFRVESTRLTAY